MCSLLCELICSVMVIFAVELLSSVDAGFDRDRNCVVEMSGGNVEHISGVAVLDNHGVNLVSSALTALVAPYIALGIWRHFV